MEFEGFKAYHTGGGNKALMRELKDGGFVLVTDDSLCVPGEDGFVSVTGDNLYVPGADGVVVIGHYKDADALNEGIVTGAGDFDSREEDFILCVLEGIAVRHGGWK